MSFPIKDIFIRFTKQYKLGLLVLADIVLMIAAFLIAVLLISGNNFAWITSFLLNNWWIIFLILAFRIGTFRNFGLYHWAWQYMSVKEIVALAKAIVISAIFIIISIIVFAGRDFPFAIIIIESFISFAFIGGLRLAIRIIKTSTVRQGIKGEGKKVLIVGAGDAGEMILREMLKLPNLGFNPIGFVDDNPTLEKVFIHQLPVLGGCEDIPRVVQNYTVEEIVIAIPRATKDEIRRIVNYCEESGAKFRIVPGFFELIDGTVHVNQIRDVEIEDLLGREQVKLDIKGISSYLSNANILITGAGGSIGSELCRKVAIYNPARLIFLGKGENSIFDIELEIKKNFPYLMTSSYIADVKDIDSLTRIMKKEKPDIIFHAAAHKHVYLMENNISEAILNNIVGTKTIVDMADKYGVKKFVMISSDKAVNPTSVMGATKRIAELIIQAKSLSANKTKYVAVRFGNVLGSRGSVIPVFKKQIAQGGPVTVTHPEARRYFMTIPEAAQLVIQAGAMGTGGEIFILDMGEPIKITDLAKDLIKLSGLEVGIDIQIKIIGLKPGEKLFEEILTAEEGNKATKHKKIFIAPPIEISLEKFQEDLMLLENMAKKGTAEEIRQKLFSII